MRYYKGITRTRCPRYIREGERHITCAFYRGHEITWRFPAKDEKESHQEAFCFSAERCSLCPIYMEDA